MRSETLSVCGCVSSGYEAVKNIFRDHVDEVGEGGAAFAAMVDGRMVVDLWAGAAGDGPWQRDTRGVMASTTKGMAAVVVARLVERDVLDVDAPVARYWPEFAVAGKSDMTVAHVLSHSAGLVSVPGYDEIVGPRGEGFDKTEEITGRLQSATPEWIPGSAHTYHGFTIGWLVSELVGRVAGVSVGRILREEIVDPLGIDLDLGTPVEKQRLVAPVIPFGPMPPAMANMAAQLADSSSMSYRMMLTVDGGNLVVNADAFNRPELLEIELPAVNGTGTARAIATVYGALSHGGSVNGMRVLNPETINLFATERRYGPERATGVLTGWGLGFQTRRPGHPRLWGPNQQAFGHEGGGGQISFADPVRKVGVGFVRSHFTWNSRLGDRLVDAVYECLP